jgi:hypothetical protein
LKARDYLFFADKQGDGDQLKEILLAPVSETRNILQTPPPSGNCAVHLFLSGGNFDFFLDDQHIGEMPLLMYFTPSNTRVFSRVLVTEGQHKLTVTTSHKPREFDRTFFCEPGDIFYVYPDIGTIKSEPWGIARSSWQYSGEITINSEPLETHDSWRRLLFYDGKWLGEE